MGRADNKLRLSLFTVIPISLYIIFIIGGIFLIVVESLGYIPAFNMTDISLKYYKELVTNPKIYKSLFFSLYISLVASALSGVIGVYLAKRVLFYENKYTKFILINISNVLIVFPYLYSIIIVIFIFSNSGIIARILNSVGLDFTKNILYNKFGLGIILTYLLKGIPFVMLYNLKTLLKLEKKYYHISQLLGATKEETIRKIYIPQCATGITWSVLVLFAYNLGSYEVYSIFSSVKLVSVSNLVYRYYTSSNLEDFPRGMVLNIILLLVGGLVGYIYSRIIKIIIKYK